MRIPRLWTQTIEEHRREVEDAILDTTAALIAQHGLLSVTMSQIAEQTGIGRATLYKYFPDVEAILLAWHERQVADHLEHLSELRDAAVRPSQRLLAVLEAYAFISYKSVRDVDRELVTFLHQDPQLARPRHEVRSMIRDLVADAVGAGELRTDVPPEELASYCLHALEAAASARSSAAVRRLVRVTLAGLRTER